MAPLQIQSANETHIIYKGGICNKYPQLTSILKTPDRIETISYYNELVRVDTNYFKQKEDIIIRVDGYSNNEKIIEIYDMFPDTHNLEKTYITKIIVHDGIDYMITRSETDTDLTVVCMDLKSVVKMKYFEGGEHFANDSYVAYFNYFKHKWKDIIVIDNDLLGVVTEDTPSTIHFCRFTHSMETLYGDFYVIPSETITCVNDIHIMMDGNLICIEDNPHDSYIRKRYYIDHTELPHIARVILDCDIDKNTIIDELFDGLHKAPTKIITSPMKYYNTIFVNTNYKFIFICEQIDELPQPHTILIRDNKKTTCEPLPQIMDWSKNNHNKDASYLIIKKVVGGDIILIDLCDFTTYELQIPDTTERNNTLTTTATVSNDGNAIFLMGKILDIVPFFSVFTVDKSKSIIKRLKCTESIDFPDDIGAEWEDKNLIIEIDDNTSSVFSIKNDKLVEVN